MEILLNMIEIFSKNPDFIILEDDAVLTPLPIDDEISSLSAILLNEAYYELLKTGQMMVDGIMILLWNFQMVFRLLLAREAQAYQEEKNNV